MVEEIGPKRIYGDVQEMKRMSRPIPRFLLWRSPSMEAVSTIAGQQGEQIDIQRDARMLLDHLDVILNYCRTKVPLGVVEAVNGNIKSLLPGPIDVRANPGGRPVVGLSRLWCLWLGRSHVVR